jgi:hypothetical protein
MKIELKIPFIEDYKAIYLLQNKEPRNLVVLVKNDNSRTSMSYARYLMCCKLERFLLKNEHVDHIDNNPLNDVIDNLQILTPKENNKKDREHRNITKKYLCFICPVCNKEFIKAGNHVNYKLVKNPTFKPCCSRSCGGKKSHIKQ